MSENKIVNVKVLELTKWGYKDAQGYVSLSKKLSENDKAALVPGAEFEGEYYIADSGTRYLNKIILRTPKVQAPEAAKIDTPAVADSEAAKRFTPKFNKDKAPDNSMSKAEWAAKDRSQLIGGLSHDAATIAAVLVNVNGLSGDQALTEYKALLEGMLKIRDEVK